MEFSAPRVLVPLFLALGLAGSPTALAAPPRGDPAAEARDVDWAELEEDVLAEMNLFRNDPRAYTAKLRTLHAAMRGKLIDRPGLPSILTQEGTRAVDEAIRVLSNGPRRLARFGHSAGLAKAARDHARDLARSGGLGHGGSDRSTPEQRIGRHGTWDGLIAENIAFGPTTAEEVVVGLLVDDGVPDRGHREVLLEKELFFAGVACGPHPTYGATCVIDYATSLKPKRR